MKLKEYPKEEKPREKVKEKGIESLSNAELLAILLRTGTKEDSVNDFSVKILKEIGGLEGLKNLRLSKLLKIKGLGEAKAITLLAVVELGKRLELKKRKLFRKIKNTNDVFLEYQDYFYDKKQEEFLVVFLNAKNEIIGEKVIFLGTANQSLVHPRDIFREAILNNAVKIICIHNHPTGDVTPSKEDHMITKRLKETGDIIGISFLDHVIIGKNKYYSFLEGGYL